MAFFGRRGETHRRSTEQGASLAETAGWIRLERCSACPQGEDEAGGAAGRG